MPRVTSFLPPLLLLRLLLHSHSFNGVRVSFFLNSFFSSKRKPWISHYHHLPLSASFLSPSVPLAFNSIFVFILPTVSAIRVWVRWNWIVLPEEQHGLLVVLLSLMVIMRRYFHFHFLFLHELFKFYTLSRDSLFWIDVCENCSKFIACWFSLLIIKKIR